MSIKSYIHRKSWRIKENASAGYSVGAMNNMMSSAESAKFWLNEVFSKECSDMHRNGDIHIHDLCMLAPYCNGWSIRQLLTEGLGGIPNKVTSAPAKYLITACNQIVNFLGVMSNESAGAQAFSSVDTYLAPFVKNENLSYKQVKQCIQSMVYGLNVESRWAGQPPFTNVTFDWVCPNDMKDLAVIIGGKPLDFTYGECQVEMDMINKAFIEIMLEGDADERLFSYPIPSYNITKEFVWDSENADLLFGMAAKYGTPYFQNFINSDMNPEDVRSMCCRLQLDKRELTKRGGGLFGANEFTGSIGVVTINLPSIGYAYAESFFDELKRRMDVAYQILEDKRKFLNELNNLDGGTLFPYTKRYLPRGWVNHFSTIGINGMHEALLNLGIDGGITTKEGSDFAVKVLTFMRAELVNYQTLSGNLYNLEATPAEGTSYRFAKHDIERYHDCVYSGTKDSPYYTNSTQLPVGYTDDVFEALELQEPIQSMYSGGTVFHSFFGEQLTADACKRYIKQVCENFSIPYISVTPTFSICCNHGYINGEEYSCPKCGQETEVYSRIVGYYRPVKNWNIGKSQEYKERKEFAGV